MKTTSHYRQLCAPTTPVPVSIDLRSLCCIFKRRATRIVGELALSAPLLGPFPADHQQNRAYRPPSARAALLQTTDQFRITNTRTIDPTPALVAHNSHWATFILVHVLIPFCHSCRVYLSKAFLVFLEQAVTIQNEYIPLPRSSSLRSFELANNGFLII